MAWALSRQAMLPSAPLGAVWRSSLECCHDPDPHPVTGGSSFYQQHLQMQRYQGVFLSILKQKGVDETSHKHEDAYRRCTTVSRRYLRSLENREQLLELIAAGEPNLGTSFMILENNFSIDYTSRNLRHRDDCVCHGRQRRGGHAGRRG